MQRNTAATAVFTLLLLVAVSAEAAVYHTVKKGENLSVISRGYGLSWKHLWDANGESLRSGNPDLIFPGEQVTIPDYHWRNVNARPVGERPPQEVLERLDLPEEVVVKCLEKIRDSKYDTVELRQGHYFEQMAFGNNGILVVNRVYAAWPSNLVVMARLYKVDHYAIYQPLTCNNWSWVKIEYFRISEPDEEGVAVETAVPISVVKPLKPAPEPVMESGPSMPATPMGEPAVMLEKRKASYPLRPESTVWVDGIVADEEYSSVNHGGEVRLIVAEVPVGTKASVELYPEIEWIVGSGDAVSYSNRHSSVGVGVGAKLHTPDFSVSADAVPHFFNTRESIPGTTISNDGIAMDIDLSVDWFGRRNLGKKWLPSIGGFVNYRRPLTNNLSVGGEILEWSPSQEVINAMARADVVDIEVGKEVTLTPRVYIGSRHYLEEGADFVQSGGGLLLKVLGADIAEVKIERAEEIGGTRDDTKGVLMVNPINTYKLLNRKFKEWF